VFCGRHLLAAKLRPSDIDASAGSAAEVERIVRQIRARWPFARILLPVASGFAREALMAWCEQNHVDYLFGLARNTRLVAMIEEELAVARAAAEKTGHPARRLRISSGARSTPGAEGVASSPRRSGRRARPIRASS
jgi:hypothetical protein